MEPGLIRSLSFLQFAAQGAVYLVDDEVYLAPSRTRADRILRVGSLAAHTKAFAERVWRTQGPVSQAREWIQRLPVLRFCLVDLIGYLEALEDPARFPPARPLLVERMLDAAAQRAAELQVLSAQPRTTAPEPGEVAKWFGAPCAILGQTVSPLERIAFSTWDPLESTCRHASLSIL